VTSSSDAVENRPEQVAGMADRILALQDEVGQLKYAVGAHAVVDQAIGVVLAVGQLTPDEGWDVLREVSQRTNIKLRHVAQLIVDWGRTGQLPADIKAELDTSLARRASPRTDG
jgi:hypothetical protein